MGLITFSGLLLAARLALAQDTSGVASYPIPTDLPYPNSTYPVAADPLTDSGAATFESSPPYYPSPWGEGLGDWDVAYAKARTFVSQLTLTEKVNLTTGVG